MQRYWINQNGIQSGPHTIDELKQMTFDPTVTYVWRSGMPDWKRIDELDELNGIVNLAQAPSQPDTHATVATAASNDEVQPEQEPEQPEQVQEQEPEPEQASGNDTAEQPHADTPTAAQPPVYHEPAIEPVQPQYQAIPPQYEPQQPQPQYTPAAPAPECPPTNLVWAIVCIVLCCWIPAVVALVFSLQVKSKYRMGDYAAAQKYSDWSAWLCIISIVLGIVSTPVVLLTQVLAQ